MPAPGWPGPSALTGGDRGAHPAAQTQDDPPRLRGCAGSCSAPWPGREVRSHPLCMGPKFHFGEWIQFDGRLESGVES
jgi:hypothetical protein